ELIVDNNRLDEHLRLPVLPRLETLMLNNNRLRDVGPLLEHAAERLPALRYLSLLGNAACPNELVAHDEEDYQRYRYLVVHRLPGLRFLDSRPVTEAEREQARRVGPFMRIVRPAAEAAAPAAAAPAAAATPPLPDALDADGERRSRATFGVCKYVYYGRHSEGN